VGDGVADDTGAFLALAAVANTKKYVTIVIPSGEYILTQDVTFHSPGVDQVLYMHGESAPIKTTGIFRIGDVGAAAPTVLRLYLSNIIFEASNAAFANTTVLEIGRIFCSQLINFNVLGNSKRFCSISVRHPWSTNFILATGSNTSHLGAY
jgi:hypothetical protein